MVQYQLRGQSIWAWSPNLQMARLIVKDSWPLILSGLLVALYVRVEQIMVMNMLGAQSAGIYYSAVRVSEVWMFLPTMILSSIYPLLVERRGGQSWLPEKLQSVFDLLTGLGFLWLSW
ncbi:MAG: oligosaccharide flippase family protein [Betaproteobacteria bacterium]|nr:oligosaccharide flippase family protein [Betaproteobacteria bacterium]